MKKVLVCLDGSKLSKAVCEYGIFIANSLNLELVLLNVVENIFFPKNVNLSGNIGVDSKKVLLDELVSEEIGESKKLIQKGKLILEEMGEFVKSKGFTNYTTLQRRGSLYETLSEFSSELKVAIIGLTGESDAKMGANVEELIRTLNIPIFLVNSEFKPVKTALMAYDGSVYAKKSIISSMKEPIFRDAKRHIVRVNKDSKVSEALLADAKGSFPNAVTASLKGDEVKEILNYQKEHDLDIIVMGAYGHNRFKSMIFESFTTKMLLNSPVPLLLFR